MAMHPEDCNFTKVGLTYFNLFHKVVKVRGGCTERGFNVGCLARVVASIISINFSTFRGTAIKRSLHLGSRVTDVEFKVILFFYIHHNKNIPVALGLPLTLYVTAISSSNFTARRLTYIFHTIFMPCHMAIQYFRTA